MRDLLGGKGAGLADMTRAGFPVPPGFTITTEVCLEYYRLGRRLPEGLEAEIELAVARTRATHRQEFWRRARAVARLGAQRSSASRCPG